MKKSIFIVVIILISSFINTSCSKKLLNIEANTYKVKELLKSENCDTDCGATADCEGKTVHVIGVLDEKNINEKTNQFFIYDSDDDYQLEVIVNDDINEDVFNLLEGNGDKTFTVSGIITGFDAPTNFSCDRLFTLKLSEIDAVVMP